MWCVGSINRGRPSKRKGKGDGKIVKCPECGKETYRYPSTINRLRCSKKCANTYIARLYQNDEQRAQHLKSVAPKGPKSEAHRAKLRATGKRLVAEGKRAYFIKSGTENVAWKGGVATLQNRLRHTPAYNQWRARVYRADGYQCRFCGTNKDLHAHHIKPFAKYPRLRYIVSNGITLCQGCHSYIHGRYVPTPKRRK